MMVYIGWGVTCWHGIYGDLILGRVGVYVEGYVWHTYTLIVKIKFWSHCTICSIPFHLSNQTKTGGEPSELRRFKHRSVYRPR